MPFHSLGTLQNHAPAESEVSQVTINTEARDAIKDLFPNIPQHDLYQIIKTAFQKVSLPGAPQRRKRLTFRQGQRKVGTATELPLARRAQLAVVAHIRHLYTDYDRLLKLKSFQEARSAVEQTTLAKVIEWRGDDENGQTVLEDVFREVIVISDDEDSETEEEGIAAADAPDQPGETPFFQNARTPKVYTQPVSTAKLSHRDPVQDPSEEAPPGFRIVCRTPAKRAIDRRGFSRYQAWNRALNRYRAEAERAELARRNGVSAEDQSAKRPATAQKIPDSVTGRDVAPQFTDIDYRAAPKPIHVGHSAHQAPVGLAVDRLTDKYNVGAQEKPCPTEDQRTYLEHGFRGSPLALTIQKPLDGRRLKEPPHTSTGIFYTQGFHYSSKETNAPSRRFSATTDEKTNMPVFVGRAKELQHRNETQAGPGAEVAFPSRPRPEAIPQDYVLPSVETPWPPENRPGDGRLEHLTQRMSLRSVTPVRRQGDAFQQDYVGAPDSPNDQNPKRRRLAHYPAPLHDTRPNVCNAKPAGVLVSQGLGPKRRPRREELVLEPRSQKEAYLDREYPSAAYQPPHVGDHRGLDPVPLAAPQGSVNAVPVSDRAYVGDSHPYVAVHHRQPGFLEACRTADMPRPNPHPDYYGDRSLRMDRVRPSLSEGPRGSLGKRPLESPRPFDCAPSGGTLYADGFVRRVDTQEVHPVQYYVQRSRPQAQHLGEHAGQPMRARVSDRYIVQESSQPHGSFPEQRQPPSPRGVTHPSQAQTTHQQPGAILRSHQLNNAPRQRPLGSGIGTSR